MGKVWGSSKLLSILLIATIVFLGLFDCMGVVWNIEAQETTAAAGNADNTSTIIEAPGTTTAMGTTTVDTNTASPSINNLTATDTYTAIAGSAENVTENITTVTMVSYITLPPITRPPTSMEIARWLSGGVIAGILVGLSIGYAVFARGVSIKRQQPSGKGIKAGEKAEKRRR